MQVPDEFWDRFKDRKLAMHHREPEKEDDLHLRCALAMCENIDWNVGRVLTRLEELDPAESGLIGVDEDRSPRAESYTQNWKAMTLGKIRLEKGEGTMSLKATEIPGAEVMDFRLLLLKRL